MANSAPTAPSKPDLRCGSKARFYDNRRCTLKARHDGWHAATDKDSRVRWNGEGSYEVEVPTHKAAA